MNVWSLFGSIDLDSTGVTRSLRETEQAAQKTGVSIERDLTARLSKLQTNLNNVGQGLTLLSAPLVAFGATALRTAGNFESSMNRVQGLTQATGEQFQRLNDLAAELGATTSFSASEAADAMGNLATAGFNVEEIYEALPGVLELAASSGLDLAEASNIAAQTLRGFGLEAEEVGRVNDVLARASSRANTDVRQLGEAFTYVAPIANGLGFSFEETSAAIGLISDAGIQASSAGTGLRSVMTQLIAESDDLGISVRDSAGNMLPLADILVQLETRGFTAEEAMAAFGETGGPALTALLSRGTESLRGLDTELQNAGGTAARLAATRMEGFNGAIDELSSAFESLQIAVAQSGLMEFVEGLVRSLAAWFVQLSELNPEVLRTATIIGAVVASIGPLLLTAAKLIQTFMAIRTAVTTVTTAITALRTVMLAAMGPAGWIVLAVTVLGGLAAAFITARQRNAEFTESAKLAAEEARQQAETTALVNTALETMTTTINTVLVPINQMAAKITESSGSVTALREAVEQAASGMSVEGAAAFRAFAEQAITSGADLKTVAAQIADRAQRESLLARVDELAAGMQGDGREAFINYAKESIATSATSQAALQAIMQAWTAVQNAGAIAAAENRVAALESSKALSEIQFNELQLEIDATKLKLEEWRAMLAERGPDAPGATGLRDSIALLEQYLTESETASTAITAGIAEINAEITTLQTNLGVLRGETVDFTTTVVQLVDSGVTPLSGAVGGLATSTSNAATAAGETKTEYERAMEAAAEAARQADQALQALAAAEEERRRALESGSDEAIAQTTAQADALQSQADAAVAFANEQLAALNAVIDGVETFEFDQSSIAASVESALSDADSISAELTRQTELLAAEIAGSNAELARLIDQRVAESDRMAAEIISNNSAQVAAGVVATGEAVNTIVTGIQNTTAATLEFFNTTVAETNALIDDVETGTERLRQSVEESNAAAANVTLPNYADGVESTMELAGATAALTQRKYELGLVTRDELVASFDAYAAAIQAEMNFIGEENIAYVGLAEKLREVVALKREIAGVGATGAGMPTGITTGITAVLNEFANRIRTVEPSITNFAARLVDAGASIASFVGSVLSQVPVFEAVINGFSVEMDNQTGQITASVDAFSILTGILSAVIGSSEAVQTMFQNVTAALQPFIDTIGTALVNALTPLLTVAVQLMDALAPIIQVAIALVQTALMPLVWILQNVFTPVITFVANVVRAIWNGIATALNTILGVFGVRIPTIAAPGEGGAPGAPGTPGAPGGGGGGGGSSEEQRMEGEILRANGVIVRRHQDGTIRVAYASNAAPAGSIQRERDTISALNQALSLSTDSRERTQLRSLIQKHQQILEAKEGEQTGLPNQPGGTSPSEPPAQRGRIEQLEARRRELQTLIQQAQTEEEIARYNAELREVDAELSRLRGLGAPAPQEPTPPRGRIQQLEARQRELQRLISEAETEEEIARYNAELRRVEAELSRLRGLGTPSGTGGGAGSGGAKPGRTPRSPRTPTTPTRPPVDDRPTVLPDEGRVEFGNVSQGVQFAVMTPIVEASIRMLQAANLMSAAVGGGTAASGDNFAALPPFTASLERLTPLLERLVREGVAISVDAMTTKNRNGLKNLGSLRPL